MVVMITSSVIDCIDGSSVNGSPPRAPSAAGVCTSNFRAPAGQPNHRGELPCDVDVLMSFRGVGPKCAHLTLGVACGQRVISVDVHVHRVTNRWGFVEATSPE